MSIADSTPDFTSRQMELFHDHSHRIVLKQSLQSYEGLTRHETYSIDWTVYHFKGQTSRETLPFQVQSRPLLRLILKSQVESGYILFKLFAETAVERKGTLHLLKKPRTKRDYPHMIINKETPVHLIGPNTCASAEELVSQDYIQYHVYDNCFTFPCVLSLQSDIGYQGKLQDTVQSNYKKLLEDILFSDVILCLGETELPAHKAVLSVQSTVFRAMFEHEMKETKENRVVIEDIEPDVMKALLTYMYTGSIENISELVEDLLKACDKYDLNESALFSYCEEILSMGIAKENVFQVLVLADRYRAENLKRKAVDFILGNIKTLTHTPEWSTFKETNKDLAIGVFEYLENPRFEINIKP